MVFDWYCISQLTTATKCQKIHSKIPYNLCKAIHANTRKINGLPFLAVAYVPIYCSSHHTLGHAVHPATMGLRCDEFWKHPRFLGNHFESQGATHIGMLL